MERVAETEQRHALSRLYVTQQAVHVQLKLLAVNSVVVKDSGVERGVGDSTHDPGLCARRVKQLSKSDLLSSLEQLGRKEVGDDFHGVLFGLGQCITVAPERATAPGA